MITVDNVDVDKWTLIGGCQTPTKRGRRCPWWGPWPCRYHNAHQFYRLRKMIRKGQAAICECDVVMVSGRDHICRPGTRPWDNDGSAP